MSPPRAWVRLAVAEGRLLALPEVADEIRAAGFEQPWELVRAVPSGPDRGRGVCGAVSRGEVGWFVKQYLRGGALARWNRERYFATGRFERELDIGARARAGRLPVVPTVAVRLMPARPGWRAWGVAPLFEGGVPLSRALVPLDEDDAGSLWLEVFRVVAAVHRAGLQHADLNLGNLLVRRAADGAWQVRMIDLDRVRDRRRALGVRGSRAVLARLERSWRKLGRPGPLSPADRAALAAQAGVVDSSGAYPA